MTMTESTTRTLDAPGATITYDVRPGGDGSQPPLMLIGSPMGAAGFVSLSSHFPDRTVVTYDPRGSERSTKDDPSTESNPNQHADDLHRIIRRSVGGLTCSPAVAARSTRSRWSPRTRMTSGPWSPTSRRWPPSCPMRRMRRRRCEPSATRTSRGGFGAGMAHFMAVTGHRGEFPDDIGQQPAPDPAQFGMPADDDGSRNDVMLDQNIINTTHYQPDFDALRKSPTRIIMAAGAESQDEMANRGAYGVARELGTEVVVFPSHHGGFLGGEYGWPGEPDAFAARLREVLG